MEGERQQSIDNYRPGGDEGLIGPHTICRKVDSSKNEIEEQTATMTCLPVSNESHTTDKEHKLKLIVRSQYWGRELKGRTCRNVYTNMNVKAPLVITSQAVLYNTDGFWGCCPAHGKRVLELQEYHFSDASGGSNWDLYLVGTWVSPSQCIHDFFLLPQNQTLVDVERNERLNGWSYIGTCNVDMIRSGIDRMLHDLLLQNDTYGHRYHHVHIDIMMEKAFDRETPRSRKLNNEKARAERKKSMESKSQNCERQESSVTTEGTASTEQESPPSAASKASNANKSFATKVVGAAPPIPRFVSNDPMPYLVPTPHSIANPVVGYQDARWAGEPTLWDHGQFSISSRSNLIPGRPGQVPSYSEHQGAYWHPAKGIPLTGVMPQQQSYWHHTHDTPFAVTTPQGFYHLQDMQMHQYHHQQQSMAHVGIQHTHQHHLASEVHNLNSIFSENQHYAGANANLDTVFCADQSKLYKQSNEESPRKSIPNLISGASTGNDSVIPTPSSELGSSPPGIASSPLPSKLVEVVEVSPVVATKTLGTVTSGNSGPSSPKSSSTVSDTSVEGSPVDVGTSAATELRGIPAPNQLLLATSNEA